jgi:hypothetical protein
VLLTPLRKYDKKEGVTLKTTAMFEAQLDKYYGIIEAQEI